MVGPLSGIPNQMQVANRHQPREYGRLGSRLHPELARNALEPHIEQHPQFTPGKVPAKARMNPANQSEMPVALAGRVKLARVLEAIWIKVTCNVHGREAVTRLDLHAMPFEILCGATAGVENWLGAEKFLDSAIDQRGIILEHSLNFRLQGHAAEHLGNGCRDRIQPAQPEEPDHADLLVLGK